MSGMKVLFRAFIVWLMLLAVPFQGLAAAGALPCAPAFGIEAAPTGEHDHAAMLAAEQGSQDDQDAMHAGHAGKSGSHCGGISPCCIGAALAPTLPLALPGPRLTGKLIPHHAAPPAAVDLATPERPPRHLFA
jgi:hypothetical protein